MRVFRFIFLLRKRDGKKIVFGMLRGVPGGHFHSVFGRFSVDSGDFFGRFWQFPRKKRKNLRKHIHTMSYRKSYFSLLCACKPLARLAPSGSRLAQAFCAPCTSLAQASCAPCAPCAAICFRYTLAQLARFARDLF